MGRGSWEPAPQVIKKVVLVNMEKIEVKQALRHPVDMEEGGYNKGV